jgi:hypothetical protein
VFFGLLLFLFHQILGSLRVLTPNLINDDAFSNVSAGLTLIFFVEDRFAISLLVSHPRVLSAMSTTPSASTNLITQSYQPP